MADIIKNFNIAGDYIDKQYVETQNILISAPQIVHNSNTVYRKQDQYTTEKPPQSKTVTPKKSSHFLETITFQYRYLNYADGHRRLSLLYQYLTKEYRETKSYIAADTTPDEFCSLFNGETNNNVITWTGSKQDLYYFIKRMVERSIIDIPDTSTIWTITQNHFSDRRGNIFLDLRNQHNPKISAEAIERLIDILDPGATTPADLTELSKKVSV